MIDKDIEILEHIALAHIDDEQINGEFVNINTARLIKNSELAQAISNVLSELETYKQAYELETYERQKFIIANNDLKEELKTWKKIAEKLAEILIYLPLGEDQKQFFTKEAVIDWARKEVENG